MVGFGWMLSYMSIDYFLVNLFFLNCRCLGDTVLCFCIVVLPFCSQVEFVLVVVLLLYICILLFFFCTELTSQSCDLKCVIK